MCGWSQIPCAMSEWSLVWPTAGALIRGERGTKSTADDRKLLALSVHSVCPRKYPRMIKLPWLYHFVLLLAIKRDAHCFPRCCRLNWIKNVWSGFWLLPISVPNLWSAPATRDSSPLHLVSISLLRTVKSLQWDVSKWMCLLNFTVMFANLVLVTDLSFVHSV